MNKEIEKENNDAKLNTVQYETRCSMCGKLFITIDPKQAECSCCIKELADFICRGL